MQTKKVKRRRLNIARTLVFILFIYLVVCAGLYIYKEPVEHYEIKGNEYVSDAEILRMTSLVDYPPFVSVSANKVEKQLKKNPLIASAKVSYGWNFTIKIEVTENKPLFKVKATGKICLSDGTMMDDDGTIIGIPLLLNDTPEKHMRTLAKNMSLIDRGVLYVISEIEYDPSYNKEEQPIDEERFLLNMTDKNLVYVTAKKIKLLNRYLDIVSSPEVLERGNGTLYLDGSNKGYFFNPFSESGADNE